MTTEELIRVLTEIVVDNIKSNHDVTDPPIGYSFPAEVRSTTLVKEVLREEGERMVNIIETEFE